MHSLPTDSVPPPLGAEASKAAVLPAAAAGDAADASVWLAAVGRRVREGRARHAMSRRMLSEASGVSERYLAQLEAGEGNPSLFVLFQIARAIGVPVARLVDGDDRAADLELAVESMRHLSPEQLRALRNMIGSRFGALSSRRHERIALIGLRGAGKSTLGEQLAAARGVPFVELDREIEREAGTTLSELFLVYGQGAYRRYERRCLEALVASGEAMIISTGGSIVSEPATFERLLAECFTVWLRASPEEHMARVIAQGDQRPMVGNAEAMGDLRRILAGREPLYRRADAVVETGGKSIADAFRDLVRSTSLNGEPV